MGWFDGKSKYEDAVESYDDGIDNARKEYDDDKRILGEKKEELKETEDMIKKHAEDLDRYNKMKEEADKILEQGVNEGNRDTLSKLSKGMKDMENEGFNDNDCKLELDRLKSNVEPLKRNIDEYETKIKDLEEKYGFGKPALDSDKYGTPEKKGKTLGGQTTAEHEKQKAAEKQAASAGKDVDSSKGNKPAKTLPSTPSGMPTSAVEARDAQKAKDEQAKKDAEGSKPALDPDKYSKVDYESLADDVMHGKYGVGKERQDALGSAYEGVQAVINNKYYDKAVATLGDVATKVESLAKDAGDKGLGA